MDKSAASLDVRRVLHKYGQLNISIIPVLYLLNCFLRWTERAFDCKTVSAAVNVSLLICDPRLPATLTAVVHETD